MSPSDAILGAYHRLAQRAWDTNRARAGELIALLDRWRRGGALSAEERERGRLVAHSLRGSAGTFGHNEAADAAKRLEEMLVGTAQPRLDVVAELIARIDRALGKPPKLAV